MLFFLLLDLVSGEGKPQLQRQRQGSFSVYDTGVLNTTTALRVTDDTFQINSKKLKKKQYYHLYIKSLKRAKWSELLFLTIAVYFF